MNSFLFNGVGTTFTKPMKGEALLVFSELIERCPPKKASLTVKKEPNSFLVSLNYKTDKKEYFFEVRCKNFYLGIRAIKKKAKVSMLKKIKHRSKVSVDETLVDEI